MIIFPATSIITSDCQPNRQNTISISTSIAFSFSPIPLSSNTPETPWTLIFLRSWSTPFDDHRHRVTNKFTFYQSARSHHLCSIFSRTTRNSPWGGGKARKFLLLMFDDCPTTKNGHRDVDVLIVLFQPEWFHYFIECVHLYGTLWRHSGRTTMADRARSTLVSAQSVLRRVFSSCQELFDFNLLFDFNDHWLVFNQIQLDCCNWAALPVDSTYSHDSRHGMIHSLDRYWLLRIAN